MNANENNARITRRQFLGTSAGAGIFAMGYKADNWISIKETGELQSALDALPREGGTIHIPTGTYNFDRPVTQFPARSAHCLESPSPDFSGRSDNRLYLFPSLAKT